MMDGAHPDELDLLAYVEEELPEPQKAAVAEHVAACGTCAESVRRLEMARHTLRSAALLELPEEKRTELLRNLPARPARRFSWRPRAVVPALAVTAVVALVAGVVLTGDFGGGMNQEAAQPGMAEEEAGDAAGAPAGGETETEADMEALSKGKEVRSVAGPPAEVATFLRQRGLDARVVDAAVHVRNADPREVRRALVGRPAGPVPVFVP
jgi:anti-sigma factor RsiW